MRVQRIFWLLCLIIITLPGLADSESKHIQIQVDSVQTRAGNCSGTFLTHQLDHMTTTPNGDDVRQFEANGSGVAINDLDNDGDLDIVLANHGGPNRILWNEGHLRFRTKTLTHGDSRAVTIIDVDNDGWRDIVFTRTVSAPTYWHNLGNGRFEQQFIADIAEPLYVIAWADLDVDGDLDLVGASYDAALLEAFGQDFLINPRGGVYVYTNDDGIFRPMRLATEAQALALILVDLNDDERLDIVVGNDFAVRDNIWLQTDHSWQEAQPFSATTYSTMSYDFADLNNDGTDELFATDMKPYQSDTVTRNAWAPVLDSLYADVRPEGDPQIMQNVLLTAVGQGTFDNQSDSMGLDATGWSWSGKFGDLDNDGLLDLYVVNGFIEYTMFGHLPNHELVEQNQVFRNVGGSTFEVMADWRLSSDGSGRGMSMGDLDNDGDLDIVVNNLRHPAQLFENQLCTGDSLQVDLVWTDGEKSRSVIGSDLKLTSSNADYHRHVKSASGYLSGDPDRIHFGISNRADIIQLEIRWIDGVRSTLELPANAERVRITRQDIPQTE